MPISVLSQRTSALKRAGASDVDIKLLLDYNADIFDYSSLSDEITFPLEDEKFVKSWQKYKDESPSLGVLPVIRKACPQLNFPIDNKIADSTEYKDAVFYANISNNRLKENALELQQADNITLELFQTDAGTLPVLYIPAREDFESILQAMNYSNANINILPSITSALIGEFRNSDRINMYRERFLNKRSPCEILLQHIYPILSLQDLVATGVQQICTCEIYLGSYEGCFCRYFF